MDRAGDPQEEQVRGAAGRAEQRREELTRARIELALLERGRRRSGTEPGSLALPIDVPGRPRSARIRNQRKGITMGICLLTFYVLFVTFADEPAEIPGSTLYQGPATSTTETVGP